MNTDLINEEEEKDYCLNCDCILTEHEGDICMWCEETDKEDDN